MATAFTIDESITLKSLDDITCRPLFQAKFELKKRTLRRSLATYSFAREQAQCSLLDCQQLHGNGYLVAINKEIEICLCEDCGATHFQTTFDKQQATFNTQERIRNLKLRLNEVLEQENAIKDRIKVLKSQPKGANWLYLSLQNFRKSYPKDLIAALEELASTKGDDSDYKALFANNTDDGDIETVRRLQGLDIFETDIKEALIGGILKPLKTLAESTTDPDPTQTFLSSYSKWSDEIEEQFELVESLIEQGRCFFTLDNMQLLKSIPIMEKSNKRLNSLRWDCENAKPKALG